MTQPFREFGEHVAGVTYVLRPCAFVVARRQGGEIAIVANPLGYFLPGGGQEEGEELEQAAIRETREETGLHVWIVSTLGTADQLDYSAEKATYFRKRSTFYLAEADTQLHEKSEDDHVLHWLDPQSAATCLSYESHRWALEASGEL